MINRYRPALSRKPIVLVVALCFLVSGLLIPVAAHLPRWIEAEMVLAAWWFVWVCALAWMLYRGHLVDDDISVPRLLEGSSRDMFDGTNFASDVGGCAPDGCTGIVVGVIVALLALLAIFVLVEFVFPLIAMLLLASIGGMFARAVNDTHGCQGRPGLSLLWGALWATIYTGPIAAVVVWVSALLTHRT